MLTNDVVQDLCNLLESFGPNGERWCKGLGHTIFGSSAQGDKHSFCILGGIGLAERFGLGVGYPETLAGNLLAAKIQRTLSVTRKWNSIPAFNDYWGTTFADIKEVICETILHELAMEEARLDE